MSYNRSITASPSYGGSGYAPLCVFSSPHFFVCEKLLRSFPVANKKPSVTAGTLGEILAEISLEYIDKKFEL
jgi:hypothetical protein